MKSVLKVERRRLGDWFLRYSLENMERIYFSPEKWAGFSDGVKEMLISQFSQNLNEMNNEATYKMLPNFFEGTGRILEPWNIKEQKQI